MRRRLASPVSRIPDLSPAHGAAAALLLLLLLSCSSSSSSTQDGGGFAVGMSLSTACPWEKGVAAAAVGLSGESVHLLSYVVQEPQARATDYGLNHRTRACTVPGASRTELVVGGRADRLTDRRTGGQADKEQK